MSSLCSPEGDEKEYNKEDKNGKHEDKKCDNQTEGRTVSCLENEKGNPNGSYAICT